MSFESPGSLDESHGLESLSEIEGYEFLSDLDSGFEEELRSLGVDPSSPTAAKPGSEEKLIMIAARYAAGLPLWHQDDCYDHGPGTVGNPTLDDEENPEVPPEVFPIINTISFDAQTAVDRLTAEKQEETQD